MKASPFRRKPILFHERNTSIPEQQSIADYLDTRCAEIDSLIAEKEALIADLEAYKKSLIYECVTGKRRVA